MNWNRWSVGCASMAMLALFLVLDLFGQQVSTVDSARWQGELDRARSLVFSQPAEARKLLDSLRVHVFPHEKWKLTWYNVCGIYFATRSDLDSAARCFQYVIDRSESNPS